MSLDTCSHVLGPIFLTVSVPYFTVLKLSLSQEHLFLKLYELTFSVNNTCMGARDTGERWFFILYISIANIWRFLWCTVTEPSLPNSLVLHRCKQFLMPSCNLLILSFRVRWWNIHTRGLHGLLIEYGPICHIVKLPVSMIRPLRPFS